MFNADSILIFFTFYLYNNFIPRLCDFESQSFFSSSWSPWIIFFLQGNNRNNVVLKSIFFLIHILFLLLKNKVLFTTIQKMNIFLLVHQQLQLQVCVSTCTECLWSRMCLWPASETWWQNVRIPTVQIILEPRGGENFYFLTTAQLWCFYKVHSCRCVFLFYVQSVRKNTVLTSIVVC